MIELFVKKWFIMIDYCKSTSFDEGVFRIIHDEYAKAWQNLDYAAQGEITERIHALYKSISS